MALKTVPFSVALTFSRPSPADYEDINGDTQTAGVDEPRFNYNNGVAEGLMLDASLSEAAAISVIPSFNSDSGTWVIKADLDKSKPIPGSGFYEFMEGSGTLVFVYSGDNGKCWADGEVLYTVDSFSAAEPGLLSNGGLAKIQSLKYYPYAWSEEKAAAESNGEFSIYYSPLFLFADGTDGYWGDSSDPETRFKGVAGTDPATTAGDEVGLRLDKSGNGNDQYQSTTAQKGTYQTDGTHHWIALDGDDDSYLIDVPAGGWAGTYVQGTMQGVIVAEFAAPEGAYQIPTDLTYANAGTDTQLVIRNDGGVIDPAELEQLVGYVGERCEVTDFAGETSMERWFWDRTDLVSIDVSRWDLSQVQSLFSFINSCTNLEEINVEHLDVSQCINFFAFAFNCHSLTSLDVSTWDTSSATNFRSAFRDCPLLTTLDVSNWDTSSVIRFDNFVFKCFALTALDLSNWDTSSVTNFSLFAGDCGSLETVTVYGGTGSPFADSPCTNYANAFIGTNLSQQSCTDIVTAIESAGTSNGTLVITGGSATTTGAAQTAVDALRARGWTVTTPDGY